MYRLFTAAALTLLLAACGFGNADNDERDNRPALSEERGDNDDRDDDRRDDRDDHDDDRDNNRRNGGDRDDNRDEDRDDKDD